MESTTKKPDFHVRQNGDEIFVSAIRTSNTADADMQKAQARILELLGDEYNVVHERCFGGEWGTSSGELKNVVQNRDGASVGGRMIRAVKRPVETTVSTSGSIVRKWVVDGATHLVVSHVVASSPKEVILNGQAELLRHGFSFEDVVRTWFYIDDILARYDQFNRDRFSDFTDLNVPSKQFSQFPASTGVGVNNSLGLYHLELYAVKNGQVEILTSAAQKEAPQYGSAFSRGAKIVQSGGTLIELSGTAAIDEQGNSLYPGDFISQLDCTLDKVNMLLQPHGASIDNLAAGCAFIANPEDLDKFHEFVTNNNLGALPMVPVIADVCRGELLFELDGELLLPAR